MLVDASTLPVPVDAGPVSQVGVAGITATTSDLYYAVSALMAGLPGRFLGGSFMRVPLGGGPSTLVASADLFVNRPVLTATRLIVTASNPDGYSIISVPLAGGPPTTVLKLPTEVAVGNGLATDGTYVYFAGMGRVPSVQAVALPADSGSPPTMTLIAATGVQVPDGLTVLGQQLIVALSQGGIESVPLPPRPNSPVTMLADCGRAAWAGYKGFFACGSNACWLDDDGTLNEISPSGNVATKIPAQTGPLGSPFDVAFDGTSFFMMGSRGLVRFPADGGDPVILVNTPNTASSAAVAVDDECVYWSNPQGIFSLAKVAQGSILQ